MTKRPHYRIGRFAICALSLALISGCATQQGVERSQQLASELSIDASSLPFVREIDERYQSFQIGMSHLTGGDTWVSYDVMEEKGIARDYAGDLSPVREPREPTDLENKRLRNLARELGPFYVRYGGTTSNSVYFQNNDQPRLEEIPEGFSRLLTRKAWRRAIDFAQYVDAKIVTGFTVSSGVRDKADIWTPAHAKDWLDFTEAAGGEIYAAEMFNEPNMAAYDDMLEHYGSQEFVTDFSAYRAFMERAAPKMKLVGPGDVDVGISRGPRPNVPDVETYFSNQPKPRFDIVSYHYYGALSERCAPPETDRGVSFEQALTEEWLSRQDQPLRDRMALRDRYAPDAPIWNTETGAAACGGPRWQPGFVDSFRYLDTNARLAKIGLDAIFTHALISGSNGVIDEKSFEPNANYWAALLWRRLMGTKILDAGPIEPGLHLYAHCQRGVSGGVTLLAINLQDQSRGLRLNGPADLYALSAPELQSRTVLLNGNPLKLEPDDTVPETLPRRSTSGDVTLAPTSINFIALPDAGNASCT